MEYCAPSFHMYFLLKNGSCETVKKQKKKNKSV